MSKKKQKTTKRTSGRNPTFGVQSKHDLYAKNAANVAKKRVMNHIKKK